MKLKLFLFAALLLSATWLYNSSTSKSDSRLPLTQTHNAGVLRLGLHYNVHFKLLNNSKSSLVLGRVRSSCGCIATDLPSKVVPVGSTFKIPIHLRPIYREKRVSERVLIEIIDGPNAFLEFVLEANIRKPISIEIGSKPHVVVFTDDADSPVSVELKNYSDKPWAKLEGYGPPGLAISTIRTGASKPTNLARSEPIETWRIDFSVQEARHLYAERFEKVLLIASPNDATPPFTEVVDLQFM